MNKFEELQYQYSDKYFKKLLQTKELLYKNSPAINIILDYEDDCYITISWFLNENNDTKPDISFEFSYNTKLKRAIIYDVWLFNCIEEKHILFNYRHKYLHNHRKNLIKLLNYWLSTKIKSLYFYGENDNL